MTREAENAKYMNVGFRKDVVGWLEWASRENGGSQAAYIDRLIRADREKRITRSNETARRYCAYLEAVNMKEEDDVVARWTQQARDEAEHYQAEADRLVRECDEKQAHPEATRECWGVSLPEIDEPTGAATVLLKAVAILEHAQINLAIEDSAYAQGVGDGLVAVEDAIDMLWPPAQE